jgi:hypothetical protein
VGFSDVMRAGSAPASCVLPTAASQRIHYPYPLYLVFWSCFLRRIKGVICPIKTFTSIVSSGSFLLNPVLPHHNRLVRFAPDCRSILFLCRSVKIRLISVISGKVLLCPITMVLSDSHPIAGPFSFFADQCKSV